jgi:protein PET100, fungi type
LIRLNPLPPPHHPIHLSSPPKSSYQHPPPLVYFGTNLDRRFAVPDFWPKPEETHRIPFEREEIVAEMERLKRKRLWLREQRLRNEGKEEGMQIQSENARES